MHLGRPSRVATCSHIAGPAKVLPSTGGPSHDEAENVTVHGKEISELMVDMLWSRRLRLFPPVSITHILEILAASNRQNSETPNMRSDKLSGDFAADSIT